MPEQFEAITKNHELFLPVDVSLAGRFWVDPAAIGTVGEMINSAHISTMVLGVESRRRDMANAASTIAPLLAESDDPLNPDRQRAAEVGIMYGSMLMSPPKDGAHEAGSVATPVPVGFVEDLTSVKNGLDVSIEHDTYNLFMRLRDIEVKYAGSDVLAFCLAATQDHMAQAFLSSHRQDDDRLTKAQVLELQSLYYAGVLLGAMTHNSDKLPKSRVEIMRGRREPVEQVGARIEFDPQDNLQNSIEYQLRSKYDFYPILADGKPAVAVLPTGVQFAPNALSMPMLIPGLNELGMTDIVPVKQIDALLLKNSPADDAEAVTLRLERDVSGYLEGQAAQDGDEKMKIAGLISKNYCISAIDPNHPWANDIERYVEKEMKLKPGSFTYANQDEVWEQLLAKRVSKIRKLGFGVALASCWIPDMYGKAALPGYDVKWTQGAAASAVVIGAAGLYRHLTKRISRADIASAQNFDTTLRGFVGNIPLQDTSNLGTITTCENE